MQYRAIRVRGIALIKQKMTQHENTLRQENKKAKRIDKPAPSDEL